VVSGEGDSRAYTQTGATQVSGVAQNGVDDQRLSDIIAAHCNANLLSLLQHIAGFDPSSDISIASLRKLQLKLEAIFTVYMKGSNASLVRGAKAKVFFHFDPSNSDIAYAGEVEILPEIAMDE
jgi:hypothetical protein